MGVTFEIDANGILNVKALDKATGNENEITITADKNRPSDEEINEMIESAKRFEAEDKRLRETVETRNQLESQAFSLLSQIDDEEKLQELQELVNPIVQGVYEGAEGGAGGGGDDDD